MVFYGYSDFLHHHDITEIVFRVALSTNSHNPTKIKCVPIISTPLI